MTYRRADRIFAKTTETKESLPQGVRQKCYVQCEIGIDRDQHAGIRDSANNFLFVGRFLYWKGGDLAIRAFCKVANTNPTIRLTMVGKGPETENWKNLARESGAESQIRFVDWVSQSELSTIYHEHDVFLFPSLHDSSGNVVLEAMSKGMPVVCFDAGGPAELVDNSSGVVVECEEGSAQDAISSLAAGIQGLVSNPQAVRSLSLGALQRIEQYSWSAVVDGVYDKIYPLQSNSQSA